MATILAQTVTDWELIICDSHSTDGAWEFFQQFKSDPRIRMYQVPREGAYAGWNECLRRATGRYIYIATSDDTMSPDCLEQLLKPLEFNTALKIAVCDFQKIDEDSRPIECEIFPWRQFLGEWMYVPCIRNGLAEFVLQAAFGTTLWFTMTSVLFRRDLLNRTGPFRTDLGSVADIEWTLRAALASDIAFVPGKMATWRFHPAQLTGNWASHRISRYWFHQSICSVLADRKSGVPRAWYAIPGLIERLSAVHRYDFYRTFHLTRWEARQDPVGFGRDYIEAIRFAPKLAWRQMCSGFTWLGEDELDRTEHAKNLLRLTGVSWPPVCR